MDLLKIVASLQPTREADLFVEAASQMPNDCLFKIGQRICHGGNEWPFLLMSVYSNVASGLSMQQYIGLFCSSFKLPRPVCGRSCDARQVPPHLRRRPPVSEPEPRPHSRGRAEFHSLVPTSSQSLQIISRQFSIMGDIRYG